MKESSSIDELMYNPYKPPLDEVLNKSQDTYVRAENIFDAFVFGGFGGFVTSQILPMEIYQNFDSSFLILNFSIAGAIIGSALGYISEITCDK